MGAPGGGERVCPGALQPAVVRVRALEAVQQLQVWRGRLRGGAHAFWHVHLFYCVSVSLEGQRPMHTDI